MDYKYLNNEYCLVNKNISIIQKVILKAIFGRYIENLKKSIQFIQQGLYIITI